MDSPAKTFDTIQEYRVDGSKVDHRIDTTMCNEGRLRLIADIIGGEACGLRFEEVTIFVKCTEKLDKNLINGNFNEAAAQLCGLVVAGTAVIVLNQIADRWNAC